MAGERIGDAGCGRAADAVDLVRAPGQAVGNAGRGGRADPVQLRRAVRQMFLRSVLRRCSPMRSISSVRLARLSAIIAAAAVLT